MTPFISAWQWSSSGFGARFSNPSVLPTTVNRDIRFSPTGGALLVTQASTTPLLAYNWSSSGFGVRYTNPVGMITTGYTFSLDFAGN
jgi:hypothetical protein